MTPPAPPALTAAEMIKKLVNNLADQEREAHGYLSRLLTRYAPQCEPLPDLMGLCSQIDNLMAGLAAPPPDAGEHERIGDTSPTYARVDGAGLAAALGAEPVAPPPDAAPGSPLPLVHSRSCSAGHSDEPCTCGLAWRVRLATEQEMSAAWRKRAEEAEAREQATPPPDGTAWLIERDYAAGTTLYWTGRAIHREPADPDRLGEWSPDVNRALRFARRTDAGCMLTWHCQDQGRVVEHLWAAPTPLKVEVSREWCEHAALDEKAAGDPMEERLRHAWETGFRLAVAYGDNHAHWDGEQRERQWRYFLDAYPLPMEPTP